MSLKYRVRLQNDRVIGPFEEKELVELATNEHLEGSEKYQMFPIGDWLPITSFPNLSKILEPHFEAIAEKKRIELEKENIAEKARERLLKTRDEKTSSAIKDFKEFKYEQGAKVDVDYRELEKKHRAVTGENEDQVDKTIVRRFKKNKTPVEIDKTIVLKKNEKNPESVEEKEETDIKDLEKYKIIISPEEMANEQTQFIDLVEILPTINAQLRISEIQLEQMAKIQESEERHREKIVKDKEVKEEQKRVLEKAAIKEDDNGARSKKGMSWIVALAFIALIYVLLDSDEPEKKKGPLFFNVNFPVTKEFENPEESKKEYAEAQRLYAENSYLKRALASGHYLTSVEYKMDNNPALGEYILNAVELVENSNSEKKNLSTIYKLIKISEKNLLKDVNVANAAATFYAKIGKPSTGIKVIKDYLRIGSKPNQKMLAIYLNNLIQAGDLVEAKKVFEKISQSPKKNLEAYLSISKYLELDEKYAEAEQNIEDALKFYPKSTPLLLKMASYNLKSQSFKKFEDVLSKLKNSDLESSPLYFAEFFKYLGMWNAINNKVKEANLNFKKSLELKESDELRIRLAELEIAGTEISQKLIADSKEVVLTKKAKEEIKNKNWDQSLSLIAEALTLNPDSVDAVIVQVQLQLRKGLYEPAIHTLSEFKDRHPNNLQILSMLIETYLKAFKFEEAQKTLVEASQTKFVKTEDYYYLYGLLFESRGNNVLAVKYLEQSLKFNPLNDKTIFKLASIFFKVKNLKEAKKQISEAIYLDPKLSDYRALYAQILYEQDNADVAIGYLRDVMSENGEDSKLLSTITSMYFKSGQLNEFKTYYKKIQNLPDKDEKFYEGLMATAKLDGSFNEYEEYARELLKANPGNLSARMNLAEYFIEKNKLNDALNELNEIKSKMPSYPRVNHLMAKVYLLQADMENAKKMSKLELSLNPNLDSAYFIVGEVYRQNREYREAITHFEKAISKNGKSVEALMGLAWVRLNQNLGSEALDLYTSAMKIEPSNAEIHRQLGYTYKALGQRSVAKDKFEDYLKLSPGASDKLQIEEIIKTLR